MDDEKPTKWKKECVVESCKNKKNGPSVRSFHQFPLNNAELCQRWIDAARLRISPTSNNYVCSDHFRDDDYKSDKRRYLKDMVVPSIFQWSRKAPTPRALPAHEADEEARNKENLILDEEKKRALSPSKDELHKKLEKQKKKIKNLQQQVRREKKKTKSLMQIIDDMKSTGLLDANITAILKESFSGLTCEIIMNNFKNKDRASQGQRYSDEVKQFALTVHFYSPRAYEYLRPILSLPHPRSLCAWTSSVECEPGFFKDAFEHIEALIKLDEENADYSLVCDGMAIKNNIIYNKRTGRYLGYIDLGGNIVVDDEDTEAKEALVFMLVSLRKSWKYPIGYVLINKINAGTLNSLLSEALRQGLEHNIKIRNITMDGTSTNFSAMRMFGCKLGKSLTLIDGQFCVEGYDYPLYFTPDPPHMLKLGRNALAELEVLLDADGNKIEWKFIQRLHEEQLQEGQKFGNKLSKKHIMYQKNKMKVNLAAQTLSNSVADAIEFLDIYHRLHTDNTDFAQSAATVIFIRKIDRLFDLLNARSPKGKGFKSPMTKENIALTDHVIDSSIYYLSGLTDETGKPLLQHRRKTFVLGLITVAKSVQKLSKYLFTLNESPFSYFLTYKISQDHIELMFNCVRCKLGHNNNPDVQEFKYALRRILLHAAISPSNNGNCLFLEEDRSSPIFSLKWTKNRSPINKVSEIDNSLVEVELTVKNSDLKEYNLAYIGGYIVRKAVPSLTCEKCCDALISDSPKHQYLSFIALKDNGGLVYPSTEVAKILCIAERVFRQFVSGTDSTQLKINSSKKLHLKLLTKTVFEATVSDIFSNLFAHDMQYACNLDEDLHSTQLTKVIASKYLSLRLARYGQEYMVEKKEIGKRQFINKLLQFNGY